MNLFQKYLVDEFAEDYEEGRLSRREALKMIASITGSVLLANSILAGCSPQGETETASLPETSPVSPSPESTATSSSQPGGQPSASQAVTVSPDDPSIDASDIQFPGEADTLLGYLARPKGEEPQPLILVCHENRGLTEHIKDVTRRLARAGYAALAVDLLSQQGGTGALTSDQVPGVLGNISNTSPDQFVQDFRSGWRFAQGQPFVQGERVGMVGFCFGGGVTWQMATKMPELLAAVPFYGPHPPVGEVPNIQAAVLAIYAERDQRINQGIPEIEAAMQQNNKIYEKVIYPNADHAFHNDTGPRYNPEAAKDAWSRTLDWFERYVKGS